MNTREQINGPRKIQPGVILPGCYATYQEAQAQASIEKSLDKEGGIRRTYEVTGVAGNYRIIERETTAELSDYISEK